MSIIRKADFSMKRLLLVSLFALLVIPTGFLQAQGRFGFGLVLGEPTGLSWKYRLNRENAIDGVLGFSPSDRFRIHADYLWSSHPFVDPSFSLHYGVGAALGFASSTYFTSRDGYFVRTVDLGFAARVPVGIDYSIPRSPVELYFELAPLVIVAPSAGIGIDAGIGVRVYP